MFIRLWFQRNVYIYTVARCMQTIVRIKEYQNTFFDLGAMTSYVVVLRSRNRFSFLSALSSVSSTIYVCDSFTN